MVPSQVFLNDKSKISPKKVGIILNIAHFKPFLLYSVKTFSKTYIFERRARLEALKQRSLEFGEELLLKMTESSKSQPRNSWPGETAQGLVILAH
jgi:hypothetical protein